MANPDRPRALGYLAVVIVAQVVVGLAFWGQILSQGAAFQLVFAVAIVFELLAIYAAFQLYKLRHST